MNEFYHAGQLIQQSLFSDVDYIELQQLTLIDPENIVSPLQTSNRLKRCARCGKEKSIKKFSKSRTGRYDECKECKKDFPSRNTRIAIYHGIMLILGSRVLVCPLSKTCTRCEEEKPLNDFSVKNDGWHIAPCKQCHVDENMRLHNKHPEKVKQRIQKRQADPKYIEYHREKERDRYNTIPEARQKTLESVKAYRKANPLKKREFESRREARKQNNKVGKVSYKRILERDGMICYICGKPIDPTAESKTPGGLAFDHIVPLIPLPGDPQGTHSEDNIAAVHHICNSRKKNKRVDQLTPFDRKGPNK